MAFAIADGESSRTTTRNMEPVLSPVSDGCTNAPDSQCASCGRRRRCSDQCFEQFFVRIEEGRFPSLNDRGQLWALLAAITRLKALKAQDRLSAKKRGGGKVRGESGLAELESPNMFDRNPGPDELVEFRDLVAELLNRLKPPLRQIAVQKLEGKSETEIATQLGVSPKTVRRKLERIRDVWEASISGEAQ